VNTRLQVEHPVTEEVTGVDLVREQFRIADGLELTFTDPVPRGHSFEFRINGEDPGRGFLPAPGAVTGLVSPERPGVRLDSGVESGSVIGGAFDSLLAKLIVTGATRQEALERSRRALDEMQVEGMATLLPFHRKVVADEAFTSEPFTVHNRWIETEFDNDIPPYGGAAEAEEAEPREKVVVEVGGRRLEVSLPAASVPPPEVAAARKKGARSGRPRRPAAPRRRRQPHLADAGDHRQGRRRGRRHRRGGRARRRPRGDEDGAALNAHKAGTVSGLTPPSGEVVTSGATICEIKD
jgi:acetyl-CoA/propionyl-CoA carboxylase biotin carboxyl carrier protein